MINILLFIFKGTAKIVCFFSENNEYSRSTAIDCYNHISNHLPLFIWEMIKWITMINTAIVLKYFYIFSQYSLKVHGEWVNFLSSQSHELVLKAGNILCNS